MEKSYLTLPTSNEIVLKHYFKGTDLKLDVGTLLIFTGVRGSVPRLLSQLAVTVCLYPPTLDSLILSPI